MTVSIDGDSFSVCRDEIDMLDEVISGDMLNGHECCANNDVADDDRTPLYLRRRGGSASRRPRTPVSTISLTPPLPAPLAESAEQEQLS